MLLSNHWKNKSGRAEIELLKPPLIRLWPPSPQRRRQRTHIFLLTKKIEYVNEIKLLKTLAQMGEGGPR